MVLVNGKTSKEIRRDFIDLVMIPCFECINDQDGRPGCEEGQKTPRCKAEENILALIDFLEEERNALLKIVYGDCEYCKVGKMPISGEKLNTCLNCMHDPYRGSRIEKYRFDDNWVWCGASACAFDE